LSGSGGSRGRGDNRGRHRADSLHREFHDLPANRVEMHGQQISAMVAAFTHEQQQTVVFGDDESVPAAESGRGVHDYRHLATP
jgi:hypothetical protein